MFSTNASAAGLPPVCSALAIISRHLTRMGSLVLAARGKVLTNEPGVSSEVSLLLLVLLLEQLQKEEDVENVSAHTRSELRTLK